MFRVGARLPGGHCLGGPPFELLGQLLLRKGNLVHQDVRQVGELESTLEPREGATRPLGCGHRSTGEPQYLFLLAASLLAASLHNDTPRSVFAKVLQSRGTEAEAEATFFVAAGEAHGQPLRTHEGHPLQRHPAGPERAGRHLFEKVIRVHLRVESRHEAVLNRCSVRSLLKRVRSFQSAHADELLCEAAAVPQRILEDLREHLLAGAYGLCSRQRGA
mmetsp:Transcript_169202/g.543974  ORF Transcript_169202/g.543974 Transcript_169202/m.543974 type:complete len:218 (-) Transcript_169202:430-1083(-)